MGVKVGTRILNWSQPSVPHSPSSSPQTIASAVYSPCRKGRRFVCQRVERSPMFGTKLLYRSRSFDLSRPPQTAVIRRSCSASLEDAFSDEEFSKKIQDMALGFLLSNDGDEENQNESENSSEQEGGDEYDRIANGLDSGLRGGGPWNNSFRGGSKLFPSLNLKRGIWDSEWSPEEIVIERKAKSVEIPLSLRMIKRKKQWQEGFKEVGESAYCSVKKAFSSLVFIIRELQSYTLQLRQSLSYEDLQGILARVQQEMNASFVWLFQQVFSHTPNLMVYMMILLANYSVYSMSINPAIAAMSPPIVHVTESVSVMEDHSNQWQKKFDSSSFSSGKTASIGGINGGGGKFRPAASGTDGDGRFDRSNYQTIIPDGGVSYPTSRPAEDVVVEDDVEVVSLWNSIVEEASKMQSVNRDEALDHDTVQRFVSPVSAKIEADDYADYLRTEMLYQKGLSQEPANPLLLANYAQFLYLVAHDYDRAEEYFLKAAKAEPKDAEALSKYATFLWQGKKDLWAAEETYLEAISIEPSNSHYAANYAHFLWNTGGEDTCYPLTSPDSSTTATDDL